MRRSEREITDLSQIIEVMRACEVCHVAFFDDEYPYVVPVNFGMQMNGNDITLYFHGATTGKKHELIKKNNKVSFVMERAHGVLTNKQVGICGTTMEYESIIGYGEVDYLEAEAKADGLRIIIGQYHIYEGETYHFDDATMSRISVLRIKVASLTGKRNLVKKR